MPSPSIHHSSWDREDGDDDDANSDANDAAIDDEDVMPSDVITPTPSASSSAKNPFDINTDGKFTGK